jgi:hypothetical protein
MLRLRLAIVLCAVFAAFAGLAAGAASLLQGSIDQAVAFTWPGVAASVALLLAVPSQARD